MGFRSFFRKKCNTPDAEVQKAQRKMHSSARTEAMKKAELKRVLEENGITLYIFKAMGGKHEH